MFSGAGTVNKSDHVIHLAKNPRAASHMSLGETHSLLMASWGPVESSLGTTPSPTSHQPPLLLNASVTWVKVHFLELLWLHLLTPLSETFVPNIFI